LSHKVLLFLFWQMSILKAFKVLRKIPMEIYFIRDSCLSQEKWLMLYAINLEKLKHVSIILKILNMVLKTRNSLVSQFQIRKKKYLLLFNVRAKLTETKNLLAFKQLTNKFLKLCVFIFQWDLSVDMLLKK